MKQVFEVYGRFLLDGMVLLMLVLLLANIRDEDGKKGIFQIVGSQLPVGGKEHRIYKDFQKYQEEAGKDDPVITLIADGALNVGNYRISDYISAKDYEGNSLVVRILGVTDSYGMELVQKGQDEITLEKPGIYSVEVSAMDAGLRETICTIRIPVNG